MFWAWGEASEGVHRLVQVLAESRLKFQVSSWVGQAVNKSLEYW